ncbi:ABC-type transport system, involved in lipoprotein release, permease component [Reichenbachiella faecimaris]|uniref:ABC-type transport system, involved in lipoprotein release, permease component n=1 Tax=Reichenbachiella faecimaris TaxID=692418 RepID=A0A1W2G8M2_REIFA|nr:FtsX-like permease family protein [Reichenbachiella faecimaris]SMD33029.1 ABC-type transport system, involved in lipoprotein release, permease component [Reichenbachiella faecimaris]
MIISLAWRNVWRNKTRSFAVILALSMGLFGALFMASMSNGMVDKWIKSSIENQISDIQVHHAQYLIMEELQLTMDENELTAVLKNNTNIRSYTARIKTDAMAMTANNSTQVSLYGIDPIREMKVTGIFNEMIEGQYLESESKFKPIIVSERLAEKLKVRLKSKIIFTLADKSGNMAYENFKVNGIFDTNNTMFDDRNVFVRRTDLQKILKLDDGQVHEIAIRVANPDVLESTVSVLQHTFTDYKAEDWKEINPTLSMSGSLMKMFNYILVGIVLIALIFGIINTMLMVILERTKEIGMLRSLGMRKKKIAQMITLETIFLCLVGGVVGNLLALVSIEYFGRVGIHFESFKEGMEQFGMSAEVYPSLDYSFYVIITVMVVFTAVFSSIFPVIRAFKLNPALAIRD